MQHLRRTLGTPEEVPYCHLCLTADKRAPEHAERRKQAREDSLRLYNELDDLAHERRCRGSLKDYEGRLEDFVLHVGPEAKTKPFRADRFHYRRHIRRRGFDGRKHVMMFGCAVPTFAPFLAESCEELLVADLSPALIKRAVALCEAFDLTATPLPVEDGLRLALEDGAVDGVWVNGPALAAAGEPALLHELARVLVPEGILHVQKAPSIGQAARILAGESDPAEREKYEALVKQSKKGADHVRFFESASLRAKLSRFNLKLDLNLPIATVKRAATEKDRAVLPQLRAEDSQAQVQSSPDAMIEEFVSFTATRRRRPAPSRTASAA